MPTPDDDFRISTTLPLSLWSLQFGEHADEVLDIVQPTQPPMPDPSDLDRIVQIADLMDALETECRRIARPIDAIEATGSDIRILRPDGKIRIPWTLFVGVDLAEVPRIVQSYVAAFEDGRRGVW